MRTLATLLSLLLTGCVSAAETVVTAPFRVAGAAWDAATTSQEEADRNRGRAIRKAEEQERKDAKRRAKEAREADPGAR